MQKIIVFNINILCPAVNVKPSNEFHFPSQLKVLASTQTESIATMPWLLLALLIDAASQLAREWKPFNNSYLNKHLVSIGKEIIVTNTLLLTEQ